MTQSTQNQPAATNQVDTKPLSLWRSLLLPQKQPVKKPPFWQSGVLLLFALVILSSVVAIWIYSHSQESEVAQVIDFEEEKKVKDTKFSQITALDSVGTFERQVSKVSFDNVVRQIQSQHPEFKNAEYAVKYKHAWTIQIMDVATEDVILDYLATQEKRDQFVYFRTVDDAGNKRYVLTFDNFNDKEGALEAIQSNEFKLPASITPFAIEFKGYIDKIDDYHLQSKVRDYTRSNPREVRLYKVDKPTSDEYNEARRYADYYARKANSRAKRKKSAYGATSQPTVNENSFAGQNKPTQRVTQQPKLDKQAVNPDVKIEEVPESVKKQNSTTKPQRTTNPAEPKTKPAAPDTTQSNTTQEASANDSISELLETID